MLPEYNEITGNFNNIDSYITNPHKWLFTPIDLTLLFFRDGNLAKNAFSRISNDLTLEKAVTSYDELIKKTISKY